MANTARRQGAARPASTEELECWAQAAGNLRSFAQMYTSPHVAETTQRVNRLLANWPTDDQAPGPEGMEGLLATKAKLDSGLRDLRKQAQAETQAIDEAMEKLQVLIALRKANESAPVNEKRAKRPRAGSSTPTPVPRVSITLPARPMPPTASGTAYSKDAKVRRDQLAVQLPLQKGRKVAFKTSIEGGDEGWIITVVVRMLAADKNLYEVVDQEADLGPKTYEANLKTLIPLPDPIAPPDSAASINTWPVYPVGTSVLAIYPETTTFYRAVVTATPEQTKLTPRQYKVKFEDDDDKETDVDAYFVVEWRE